MSDAVNPYDQMAEMWKRYLEAFQPSGSAPSMPSLPGGGDPREMMEKMTEAHLAVVGSGFRALQRWAELSGRAYPQAVRAMSMGAMGGEGAGAALDELRETYRLMAELPMKESRRLQDELAELWSPPGSVETGSAEGEAPKRRRRARVKD